MPKETDTRDIWRRFSRGDHITDVELNTILEEAKAALPYLQNRGETFALALIPTKHTINNLEDYKRARQSQRIRSNQLRAKV